MFLGFLRGHWLSVTLIAGLAWIVAVRLYYLIKPSLPTVIRLCVRRWSARRKRAARASQWPILECAGVAPKDWSGWPEACKFAFVLTHDVESQRGLDRVRQLAELEISLGFRSSFNFIPEGTYQVPSELRDWLVENDFEVGVHDHRHDGKLYNSRESFGAGATRINQSNDIWKQKLKWIESRGGMALLNVHPDYVAFGNARPTQVEFPVHHYAEFLSWVKETRSDNYWHALPRGVADFCRKCSCRALALMMAVQATNAPEVLLER